MAVPATDRGGTVDNNDEGRHVEARDVGHVIRLIIILAVLAALVAVALDNTDDVRVGWVVGDSNGPLWIVLIAAAIGGIIIGWLLRHRPRRHT